MGDFLIVQLILVFALSNDPQIQLFHVHEFCPNFYLLIVRSKLLILQLTIYHDKTDLQALYLSVTYCLKTP